MSIDRDRLATLISEAMRVDPYTKNLAASRHLGVAKALGVVARTFAGHIEAQEERIEALTKRLEKVEKRKA